MHLLDERYCKFKDDSCHDYDMCLAEHGAVAAATGYEGFAREDDKDQVESVREHLQERYAPPGVKVIAATGVRWLEATFKEERVEIKTSNTDFAFLAKEALERYERLEYIEGTFSAVGSAILLLFIFHEYNVI